MLSVATVAVHSFVDYPMRAYGIALPVAYLIAIILCRAQSDKADSGSGVSDVVKIKRGPQSY